MLTLVDYTSDYYDRWNEFVKKSVNGTIFQRLDFLSYHGERFNNHENHALILKGQEIWATLPIAYFTNNGKSVGKSPYGGSYGGIVVSRELSYLEANEIVNLLKQYWLKRGQAEIHITPKVNFGDCGQILEFCLLKNGFEVVNSDALSVIKLVGCEEVGHLFTASARRHYRKGLGNTVRVELRSNSIDDFWCVLEKNFEKFDVSATHSKAEWQWLCDHFPREVWMDIAYLGDVPVAAIGQIKIDSKMHSAFYILQDPAYQDLQALTLLFHDSMTAAIDDGISFYDLGTSSVNMEARANLFRFKESLGAIALIRNSYKLEIYK